MTSLATLNTAQDYLESMARSVIAGGLARMAEYVDTPDNDIEVVIKIVNSAAKEIGNVIPEKKLDPNAGLATFHITFINGAMQGTVTPAADVVDMEPVDPADAVILAAEEQLAMLGFVPSETMTTMLATTNMNADLAALYTDD